MIVVPSFILSVTDFQIQLSDPQYRLDKTIVLATNNTLIGFYTVQVASLLTHFLAFSHALVHFEKDNSIAVDCTVGETRLHAGETRLHAGETRLHTSETRLHAGETRLHAGETRLHTSETRLHAGETRLHAGETRLHAGETRLHAGETRMHAGESRLHAGETRTGIERDSGALSSCVWAVLYMGCPHLKAGIHGVPTPKGRHTWGAHT